LGEPATFNVGWVALRAARSTSFNRVLAEELATNMPFSGALRAG